MDGHLEMAKMSPSLRLGHGKQEIHSNLNGKIITIDLN